MIRQVAFAAVLDLDVLLIEAEKQQLAISAIARSTLASLKALAMTPVMNHTLLEILKENLGSTVSLDACLHFLSEKFGTRLEGFAAVYQEDFDERMLDFILHLSLAAVRKCMRLLEASYVMASKAQALSDRRTCVMSGKYVNEQGSLEMWLANQVFAEIRKRYPSLNLPK